MAWDTGAPVSADPTGYISDRIKNNIGIGAGAIRNWSFIENIPEGTVVVEKQRLTLTGWGAGDSFKVTFNGNESAAVVYAIDISATLLAAINALADFNTVHTRVTVTKIDANNYDISNTYTTKWYGVAFDIVGTFTMTTKVGCDGSWAQQQAPIMRSDDANFSVDIFKCTGTGNDANDCGQDFYILLARDKTAAATGFQVTMVQEWNTTYKKTRYNLPLAGGGTSNLCGVDVNGWPTYSTYVVPGNYYPINKSFSGNGAGWSFILNKTGFTYQIKMTKDLIIFSFKVGTTDFCIYMGLFDSLITGVTDTYPLCCISGVGAGGSSGEGMFLNLTTAPGAIATGINYSWGVLAKPWTKAADIAVSNATNMQDKWANGGIWTSRVFIYHAVSSLSYYLWGGSRGLLKNCVLCFPFGGTVNMGDTMTVGETSYKVMGRIGPYGQCYIITTAD